MSGRGGGCGISMGRKGGRRIFTSSIRTNNPTYALTRLAFPSLCHVTRFACLSPSFFPYFFLCFSLIALVLSFKLSFIYCFLWYFRLLFSVSWSFSFLVSFPFFHTSCSTLFLALIFTYFIVLFVHVALAFCLLLRLPFLFSSFRRCLPHSLIHVLLNLFTTLHFLFFIHFFLIYSWSFCSLLSALLSFSFCYFPSRFFLFFIFISYCSFFFFFFICIILYPWSFRRYFFFSSLFILFSLFFPAHYVPFITFYFNTRMPFHMLSVSIYSASVDFLFSPYFYFPFCYSLTFLSLSPL